MTSASQSAPIFIGGLMKSGTSLLRKLLSRHPAIFGGLETHWFDESFRTAWQERGGKKWEILQTFFSVDSSELDELAERADGPEAFLTVMMEHCAERDGKVRWVEKTPDNILHIERIWEHWPEAKVLHVVRDHRDVYASWKARKGKNLDDFLPAVRGVLDRASDVLWTESDRYLEVRYEQLVSETDAVLERVCTFLGEPYPAALADYEGDDTDYQRVLEATGKISATTESLRKPVFTSSVGQWKELIEPSERETIERELGDPMRRWGFL